MKINILILIILMSFFATGCSDSKSPSQKSKADSIVDNVKSATGAVTDNVKAAGGAVVDYGKAAGDVVVDYGKTATGAAKTATGVVTDYGKAAGDVVVGYGKTATGAVKSVTGAVTDNAKAASDYGKKVTGALEKGVNMADTVNLSSAKKAVKTFHYAEDRYPRDLEELSTFSQMNLSPKKYLYNSTTGELTARKQE